MNDYNLYNSNKDKNDIRTEMLRSIEELQKISKKKKAKDIEYEKNKEIVENLEKMNEKIEKNLEKYANLTPRKKEDIRKSNKIFLYEKLIRSLKDKKDTDKEYGKITEKTNKEYEKILKKLEQKINTNKIKGKIDIKKLERLHLLEQKYIKELFDKELFELIQKEQII